MPLLYLIGLPFYETAAYILRLVCYLNQTLILLLYQSALLYVCINIVL